MRYLALACDYDGTLATGGRVSEESLAALEALRATGRRLILVTGRQVDDLLQTFPQADLFERIVAENGALLYCPATHEEKALAAPPPEPFLRALQERGVAPLSVGRVIVATWEPHAKTVLDTIQKLGLELHVIFNKGAVMVLPSGVNKATGLAAVLPELGLSPHNVVAVGDAENDHAFFELCEYSVAVANALPLLKERADYVTEGRNGAGVEELIDGLIRSDLCGLEPRLERHNILLGTREDGSEFRLRPYGVSVLLAGPSGSVKSTLATGFLERLHGAGYQFVIIDPEGDYETFAPAVSLGHGGREPSVAEVLSVLDKPSQSAVVNLLGIALEHRRSFFEGLLLRLQELRARTGRPHWIVIDEAHHLLPSSWDPSALLPQDLKGILMITVHPDKVAPVALAPISLVIAVGESPAKTLQDFSGGRERRPPSLGGLQLQSGEALAWWRQTGEAPSRFRVAPSKGERLRHQRKYAEGSLPPERSFYFRGPEGKLHLRAQNLQVFLQLAEGVDDETWLYHLRRHDYSRWFREFIKDEDLSAEAARIESQPNIPAQESRARIKEQIEQRYTATA